MVAVVNYTFRGGRGVWGLKIKEKYLYRIGMNIRNVLLSTLLLYIIYTACKMECILTHEN